MACGDKESEKKFSGATAYPAPKKPRYAFPASFLLALLMILLSLVVALAANITDEKRFENALLRRVPYQELGTDEASVHSFAVETIRYLRGSKEEWSPEIAVYGVPASAFIPQSFREHMAEVRRWVISARAVTAAGIALILALTGWVLLGGRRSGRSSFSLAGYYTGAFVPLAAIGGLGAWACLDFDGMWAWLHQTFIPDGIFSAAEPVMRLFPAELFADYLPPVAAAFGAGVLAALVLPLLLNPLARRIAGTRR